MKSDNCLFVEHGKPMIFGKDKNKGIRLNGLKPEIVDVGKDCGIDDLLIHDEKSEEPTLAYLLSRMYRPEFPEVFGVLRNVRKPTYEELLDGQINEQLAKRGKGKIEDLFAAEDTWTVE